MSRAPSALWELIRDLQIDEGDVMLTFAARLARENGWSRGFAERAVMEYKRFVFLAMVAEHPVTPSDAVDEAWHLHLTYTRSYWDGLCRNVLGRPLHHVPTRGGPAEQAKHIEQYEKTLASYKQWFGQAAPVDIWPPAEVRFARDAQHVRVNRQHAWIIPKLRWPRRTTGRDSMLVGAFAVPLLVGVTNPLNLDGPQFLVFYAFVGLVAIVAAMMLRQFLRTSAAGNDDAALSPYEVACLGGGVPGLLRTCLAALVADKRLQLRSELLPSDIRTTKAGLYPYRAVPPLTANHEIERAMLREASQESGALTSEMFDAARPLAEQIESDLQGRGLMETDESFAAARWGPLVLLAFVWLLGLVKIFVGIGRDKPVAFLVMGVVALTIVMAILWRRPLRTRRGEARLQQLKEQHKTLQSFNLSPQMAGSNAAFNNNDLLLTAGLFGLAAMHHPDIDFLNKSLKPVSTTTASSGGCGAATSCGGGGDGGGGGGCGGGGCGGCGGG